jgi:hypothetical protein
MSDTKSTELLYHKELEVPGDTLRQPILRQAAHFLVLVGNEWYDKNVI